MRVRKTTRCVLQEWPNTETECFITTEDDCLANHHIYFGNGSECTSEIDCSELLVEIDAMSAELAKGGILIRWRTVVEIDTVGFRLLREMPGTPASRQKRLVPVGPTIAAMGDALAVRATSTWTTREKRHLPSTTTWKTSTSTARSRVTGRSRSTVDSVRS